MNGASAKIGLCYHPESVAWLLPKHEVKPFARNTLRAVIVQLRFHPILKIVDRLPDFQEKIRTRFPGYEKTDAQMWEVGPAGVQLKSEHVHRFNADGEPIVVSLGTNALSIEYTAHKDRKVLLDDVRKTLEALVATYSSVSPVRLGLRYVNLIDKEKLGQDLGRSLDWTDVLTKPFAGVPGSLADRNGTFFVSEISSPCERGSMTVRFGLLPELSPNSLQFRLDTDRFIDGGFQFSEVSTLLDQFSSDIFQVFKAAAGDALLAWMAT